MKTLILITLLLIELNLLSQNILKNDASYYRGSITAERLWWDVQKYNLEIQPILENKILLGNLQLNFRVTQLSNQYIMQLDLQNPMHIDSVKLGGNELIFNRIEQSENVYFIHFSENNIFRLNEIVELNVYFSGKPKEAKTPPWDGGWIWSKDKLDRDWISLACQGLGASVWFPCKDHQSDEPDEGMEIKIHCPSNLKAVSNGRLISVQNIDNELLYHWKVVNPINLYNITVNIGSYISFRDNYQGLKGDLTCDYWVLDYELGKAKKQFKQVQKLLKAFEFWFGPYPFYEDGYKVIQTPFLGMEHQSGIAYGNNFKNGYKSTDLSKTGWGLKFDFILIHESGHEWFGNNITSKDLADLWIHEAFTTYSEVLFLNYWYNKKAGDKYVQGIRNRILNDIPIIASYDINEEGSGDMYFKGANLVHILRLLMNNDQKFKELLSDLNLKFYHQTVTTEQIEKFIQSRINVDLSKIFDQYLRTIQIPALEYKIVDKEFEFKWVNCVEGFNLPLRLTNGVWIYPTDQLQKIALKDVKQKKLEIDSNFYVNITQK